MRHRNTKPVSCTISDLQVGDGGGGGVGGLEGGHPMYIYAEPFHTCFHLEELWRVLIFNPPPIKQEPAHIQTTTYS
jgi:hypothetical protein